MYKMIGLRSGLGLLCLAFIITGCSYDQMCAFESTWPRALQGGHATRYQARQRDSRLAAESYSVYGDGARYTGQSDAQKLVGTWRGYRGSGEYVDEFKFTYQANGEFTGFAVREDGLNMKDFKVFSHGQRYNLRGNRINYIKLDGTSAGWAHYQFESYTKLSWCPKGESGNHMWLYRSP